VWAGVLAFAAAAGVVAACASLLGIDDRSLDTGDAASSGAQASGATNGSGVASGGGSGVASGSSGSASGTGSGTGSSAGAASGAAGTGSSAGAVSGSASGASTGSASGANSGSASGANSGSSAGAASGSGGGHDAGPDVATSGSGGGPDAQPDIVVPTCPDPCVMATGLNHPFMLASDADRVYWTEWGDNWGSGNGTVKSCPLTGCSSGQIVYVPAQTNPRGIAVDAQNVYWSSASYGGVTGGIWSCPLSGCPGNIPTRLAKASIPFGVTVDSTYVYWVDDDGTVHRVAKANGTDGVLYDGGDYDGNTGLLELKECVVDNASVYVSDYFGDIYRVPVAGGDPVAMAGGTLGAPWLNYPVTADSTYVYYGQMGQIFRSQKTSTDGGIAIADVPSPDGLTVDRATGILYWSDYGTGSANDGTVGKVGIDGGNRAVMAGSLATPFAVTVSGNYVFWLSFGKFVPMAAPMPSTGTLTRMAK
jgi:hypothetical protein